MTRKRFVKLLMSQGVRRNTANSIARNLQTRKGGYKEAYKTWNFIHNSSHILDNSVSEDLKATVRGVSTLVNAICASVRAFSSVLTVSMQKPDVFGGICHRCGGTGVEKQMQALATFEGTSVRGPDKLSICSRCLGTGRELV